MDAFLARQPILDTKQKVRAYELLFRDGLHNAMPRVDGDIATSTLLSNSFYTIGIENITGGKKAFINFTRKLLVDEIPLLFPKETTVIEILEDVEADDAVVDACRRYAADGYVIALDDFVFHKEIQALIDLAHVIKIDFRQTSMEEVARYLRILPTGKVILLAEKVETLEEFRQAIDMGFGLFQGYFFSKPEILRGRGLTSSKMSMLQIMAEISRPEIAAKRLESCISHDVSISYKLMKYMNSSFFRREKEIGSIKHALLMLGEREIRRFLSLIVLSKLNSDKPSELMRMACTRAKFLEHLAPWASGDMAPDTLFTLGLFSNIDAILDQPMETILKDLPLAEDISEALIHQRGRAIPFLRLTEAFERAQWEQVHHLLDKLALPADKIPGIYQTACYWSNTLRGM